MGLTEPSKVCAKCSILKPLTDFSFKDKARGRRQSYCSECMKPYRRDHYHNNKKPYYDRSKARKEVGRQWLLQILLTKSCVDCGETDPVVLEFDHVRGVKVKCVSKMILENSRESFLKEMEKCDVRCANCHRRKTAKERGWYKLLANRPLM